MLRSRRQAGKYNTNCYFGCCPEYANKKQEKRIIKRKENREWKKESNDY
jgi:hypothetical protein